MYHRYSSRWRSRCYWRTAGPWCTWDSSRHSRHRSRPRPGSRWRRGRGSPRRGAARLGRWRRRCSPNRLVAELPLRQVVVRATLAADARLAVRALPINGRDTERARGIPTVGALCTRCRTCCCTRSARRTAPAADSQRGGTLEAEVVKAAEPQGISQAVAVAVDAASAHRFPTIRGADIVEAVRVNGTRRGQLALPSRQLPPQSVSVSSKFFSPSWQWPTQVPLRQLSRMEQQV